MTLSIRVIVGVVFFLLVQYLGISPSSPCWFFDLGCSISLESIILIILSPQILLRIVITICIVPSMQIKNLHNCWQTDSGIGKHSISVVI